ncbi:MAG TPA: hypothetical protein VLB12_16745, partial [Gemmatimonadales bacterium]|nr:hypothetical protein [Gemmatimonadales bacterium]
MRLHWTGLLAVVLAACGRAEHHRGGGLPELGTEHQSPVVVRKATLVVFWLPASDTLGLADGADLLDDFRYYTAAAAPWFKDQGIPVVTTNTDTIVVEAEGAPRRVIMLSGLDYPFGYVLVDPGYPEEILTGVLTDDELVDEADGYFGSNDDEEDGGTQRVRFRPPESASQYLLYLADQRGRGERLLQKSGIGKQPA